jgi:hypothetical protein
MLVAEQLLEEDNNVFNANWARGMGYFLAGSS